MRNWLRILGLATVLFLVSFATAHAWGLGACEVVCIANNQARFFYVYVGEMSGYQCCTTYPWSYCPPGTFANGGRIYTPYPDDDPTTPDPPIYC